MSDLRISALGVLAVLTWIQGVLPTQAATILPGRCHMGSCYESKLISKKAIRDVSTGTLYVIETAGRSWPMQQQGRPSESRVPFKGKDLAYVFCSTSRPAYIFKNPDGVGYYAHLLNPDGKSYFGYNQGDYAAYWATCHNLVGPDFFSEAMVVKSIQLGYPGNLPQDQIELNHPTDIIR